MKDDFKIPQSYAESGVDINSKKVDLDIFGSIAKQSFDFGNHKVLANFGHYANLIEFGDFALALTTDGVGSKLLLAQLADKYDTIGIDCVAMNVNDLLAMGIKPIGFVDYLAIEGSLGKRITKEIASGLLEGCKQSNIPLLGGELATLPEIIKGEVKPGFDLAGTAMGYVKKHEIVTGEKILPGDIIIGLKSSGIHSNGYTLARKIISGKNLLYEEISAGKTWIQALLEPTMIYVKEIMELINKVDVKGMAHITGGAYTKLRRLTKYGFYMNKFPKFPIIFENLQKFGKISNEEMCRTFNLGFGFIIVISKDHVDRALNILGKDNAIELGVISENSEIIFPELDVIL
jgi:phosphoribosylformylglycinamidine cyclo-ligase